ncbi:peptidase M56 [Clostridium sp. MCC353]|uniref:M56 family metallopeptidase n=1 Tax=Clostridium sp. MCC353 TaxID=2592646 RepID=UPI001C01FBB3|nr:M56 family metallopeptidase [Clostridium sp. MCC353]MBT9775303.1 peptidase M56 [Clostridium sp. MCC353]
MDGFMIRLLNMSFTAGCACLLVIVLRVLIRRLPKIYSYALWGIVLFRFLCPFTLETAVSLLPVNPETVGSGIIYDRTPSVHSGVVWFDNSVNQVLKQTMTPAGEAVSANPVQIALFVCGIIWLAGAAGFAAYHLISYLCLRRKLKDAVKLKRRIFASEKISSPFAMGIFNPRIYLPYGLSKAEEKCIVAHEWVHIRRRDGLVKMLGMLVLTIHWFNPMAWIGISLMCKDMEMACDETALKHLGMGERQQYTMTLFNVSLKHSGLLLPTAFGESNTKIRIKNILSYKKPAVWMSACAVIILVISAVTLMTNPKREKMGQEGPVDPVMAASEEDNGAMAVSIIGGSDGPTSIFLAGKLGDGNGEDGGAEGGTIMELPVDYLDIGEERTPAAIGKSDNGAWMIYGDFGFYYFERQDDVWRPMPFLKGKDLDYVREFLNELREQDKPADAGYLAEQGFSGKGLSSMGIVTYDVKEMEDKTVAVLGSFSDSAILSDLFFGLYDPAAGTLTQVYPFGGDGKTIVNEKGRISYRRYLFSDEGWDYFIRTPATMLDFEGSEPVEGRMELVRFADGEAEVLDNLFCLRDLESGVRFDQGFIVYQAAREGTKAGFEQLVTVKLSFDGSSRSVVEGNQ